MKRPDVNRPLIFAHRGANHVCPENTLPAFAAAVDLGADGVELDVQFSSDGRLVIIHDYSLDKTTSGKGRVVSLPYADLQQLDAGSWFAPEFAATCIPTLDQVLDLLKGKLLINIELKSLDMASTLGRDVVRCVREHDMAEQVVLSSFNPFTLRGARRAGPEFECALLISPDLPGWMRSGLTRRWSLAQALHPEFVMVDERYMADARKRKLPVRPWTVNEEADMRRMLDLGVDAIITDWPDRLKALLR